MGEELLLSPTDDEPLTNRCRESHQYALGGVCLNSVMKIINGKPFGRVAPEARDALWDSLQAGSGVTFACTVPDCTKTGDAYIEDGKFVVVNGVIQATEQPCLE